MKIKHTVDAKHLKNIGEQSVSSPVQALIELVKNSHDADALNCKVHFYADVSLENFLDVKKIVIEDDGFGMTFEDIRDKWMRIGTKSKEEETVSRFFNRRVSGAKGMGHFACQKLGNKITLKSSPMMWRGRKSERPDENLTLNIDWNDYQTGENLTDIPNELVFSKREDKKHGIILEITDLKYKWTKDDIEEVHSKLGNLLPPKFISKRDEHAFKIEIEPHGFELSKENIESTIEKYAPWEIRARLRGSLITYTIYSKKPEEETRRQANPISAKIEGKGKVPLGHSHEIGDVEIKLFHFKGRATEWAPTKVRDSKTLADQLDSNAGIKIYNDNVRVMPYGSKGNDWVGLGPRYERRTGSHIRNEQTVGFVTISKDGNPGIRETTTRERLEENLDFYILKNHFVLNVIEQLENYIEAAKEKNAEESRKVKAGAAVRSDVKQVIDFIEQLDVKDPSPAYIEQKKGIAKKLKEIEHNTKLQDEQQEEEVEELTSNLEMYRNLSSLGISALTFHHELTTPLSRIDERVNRLLEKWNDYEDVKKIDYLTKSTKDVEIVRSLNSYIREFAALFKGAKGASRKREQMNIEKTIKKIENGFGDLLRKHGIKFEHIIGPGCERDIWMNQASFESVIINLFSNSFRALTEVGRTQKTIKVTFEKSSGHLTIRFYDNGHGINEHNFERIFNPLWTTYKGAEKAGTGMGATLIREIIQEDYGGKAEIESSVEDVTNPGKGETVFLIRIPLDNLQKEEKSVE